MAATAGHDVTQLNSLIEVTLDSADGYGEASKGARNARFTELFARRAAERQRLVRRLQQEVRSRGGTPEEDGTILAAAHRMFLNLKTMMGDADKAIVEEVERGEDHIKAAFEKVLADQELSPPTRTLVSESYGAVKADHDQMRDIKHDMEAAR